MKTMISKSGANDSNNWIAPGLILIPALIISYGLICISKTISEGIEIFSLQWTKVSSKSNTIVILSIKYRN